MIKISTDHHKLIYHPKRVAEWIEKDDCFPVFVEISPTNRCNHKCAFCALDWVERGGRDINSETMINSLKNMADNGVKALMWAGEGEPFLHKDMSLFLKKAKEFGMDSSIATNAVLLTKERIEESLPYLSWVRFSVDSGCPENYAKVHGTNPNDFNKALENIKAAVKFRNNHNLKTVLGVQLVMIPLNKDQASKLAIILKEIGVDNFQLKPYSHHPNSMNDFSMSQEDHKFIEDEVSKFSSDNFQVLFRKEAVERTYSERPYESCMGLPFFTLIDCRGNVIPCSHFYKNENFFFGNLNDNSFSEIWDSERRKEVLKKISKIGTGECRKGCRLDLVNRYLDRLKNPHEHDNFL
ncbi:MAG: radical SAM protein [Nanoarchaeota archaeon]|nr:radical SAM protein [Nanoarchaeota archaeon]